MQRAARSSDNVAPHIEPDFYFRKTRHMIDLMSARIAGTTLWSMLLMMGATTLAVAQQGTISDGATAPAPPSGDLSSLSQVTVEGHTLEAKTRRFVLDVTAASGFFLDAAVQQWRRPICPMVAGLPRREGQLVFDRLETDFGFIGVALGEVGCHPNFFVIVTREPDEVLRGAWRRNWQLFGDASPTVIEQFIRTRRPIRVWYNNIPAGEDGPAVAAASVPALASDPLFAQSQFAGVPTITNDGNGLRARFGSLNDLLAVVAIVDPAEVQGFNWAQIADYIAMTGLTRIAPDVRVRDTPSILQLFAVDAESRPQGLSNWDRSFLKDLYGTDPGWRGQRLAVSRLMARDLLATATDNSR
jgi:hypothetical protein